MQDGVRHRGQTVNFLYGADVRWAKDDPNDLLIR
ncbi:hypothetical protein P3T16_006359 [Paraburkholderia sp. GAS42]